MGKKSLWIVKCPNAIDQQFGEALQRRLDNCERALAVAKEALAAELAAADTAIAAAKAAEAMAQGVG